MNLTPTAFVVGSFVAAISLFTYAKDIESKRLSLSAQSLGMLEIDAGAGELVVRGEPNREEIVVEASIHGNQFSDNDYRLSLEKRGGRAELTAKNLNTSNYEDAVKIDLLVLIPQNIRLTIEDGSGDIRVESISEDIKIEDGSGNLLINTISGDLNIEDGSGDTQINTVTGDIRIDDGSGELRINTVTGNLQIDDASGYVGIDTVTGNVDIEDGSGAIDIRNVLGSVRLDDGAGNINLTNVGDFELIDDGSGQVTVDGEKLTQRR